MEFNENKPIYLQLADQIMDEVESSVAREGERLLSVRDYAAKSGVNANTVMRTYTWLQQEGIIYNQRGIGFFYADNARELVLKKRREIFYAKQLPHFLERLVALQISPQEFTTLYQNYIKSLPTDKDRDS